MTQPLSIVKFIADMHFGPKAPLARAEEDWYAVLESYWWQIVEMVDPTLPICIVGDVFDRAAPPLELINFVLGLFQSTNAIIYTIAGNHDLPLHALSEMNRSAYGILKECGAVDDIGPGQTRSIIDCTITKKPAVNLYGFPCGCEVKPLENPLNGINVAVVHDYIWGQSDTGYPGAPENKQVEKVIWSKRLKGFNWAVYGDNHTPFIWHSSPCAIYNNGTFIRRKRDEIKHQPGVGILYSDGVIRRHLLDTSQDKFTDAQEVVQVLDNIGANTFVEELLALGDVALDFAASIRRLLNRDKVDEQVKELILRCLDRASDA